MSQGVLFSACRNCFSRTSTASAGFNFGTKSPAFSGLGGGGGWGGEGKFCVAILILTLATIGLPGRFQTNIFFIFHAVDSRYCKNYTVGGHIT